jgi:hypothetical protein
VINYVLVSIAVSVLDILEEEDEVEESSKITVEMPHKETEPARCMVSAVPGKDTKIPREATSSSSSSSSTSSFKSAKSQLTAVTKPPKVVLQKEISSKGDNNKKYALDREREAQKNKDKLLQQKKDIQQK